MKKEINFVKYRFVAIGFSILFLLVGIAFIFINGFKFGIDFTGGISFIVQIDNKEATLANVRETVVKGGFGSNVVQIGSEESKTYNIKIPVSKEDSENQMKQDKLKKLIEDRYGQSNVYWLSINLIGATMSKQFLRDSIWLVLVVFVLILFYILIRFKHLKFSIGAVVALIHDVLLTLSLLIILKREFTLNVLAAILTLIGYSLNDTIVVYSRIRENYQLYPKMDFSLLINKSINETLSRTIITSLTTFFVVFMIFIFGGEVLRDFGLALSFGIVVGTYSSIFIASPILIQQSKKQKTF
ncbi:MAG: protein translocase subunit SecF [Spirochaetes bacterium]|nr:protein translocase subunit SecF [Spirochaetota bacterium]